MNASALYDDVANACRRAGDRTALGEGADRLSYRDLAVAVAARAADVEEALRGRATDRVALHAANSAEYVVTYLAVLRTGRVPLLVDAEFGGSELAAIREGCGVEVFLVDQPRVERVPHAERVVPLRGGRYAAVTTAPVADDPPALHPDTAVCRFTSGSTGSPKCLEFSRAAVVNAARNWVEGTGMTADDRTLCLAALTNGLAFNTSLLSTFLVGAELHLFRGLPTSARVLRAMADSGATRLVAFPAVYRVLADADLPADRFTGLSVSISAGAPLPADVRARFEQRYSVRIADYYGIAETGPCTFERDPAHRRGLGTPLPGVALRIARNAAGQQEVMVRSASMATRYLNAPGVLEAARDVDGFHPSGDIGHWEGGRLFVTGRTGGPVNLAGRKVDPREVEQVVRAVPGVRDAVVFADRDADDQVFLHAAVAADGSVRRADVVAACRGSLAPFKVPQKVTFVPDVPRSSPGKVRMTDLLRLVRGGGEG
uniref:Acyl-CoA synthetase n=1 Tax=Streptoalloteichus sp. ATCC 53650 TaxID=756733 RepID=K4NYW0_9PSEU|nr:acyl-CoA synthetase [Streptoalloteichus sp. ATCC 53650]